MNVPIHGSPWFDVREWVDERTWRLLGANSAYLVDPKIIRVADLLRTLAGSPIVVNSWSWGGKYVASGFRAVWEQTGGVLSQHRCGRAGDFKSNSLSPTRLYRIITANKDEFIAAGLSTVENLDFTPGWLHCDVRPRLPGLHPENDILIVDPA